MSNDRWSDLTARVLSAAGLTALGAVEVWLGGLWFEAFIAAACGVMTWELVRMVDPGRQSVAIQIALLTAFAVVVSYHLPPLYKLPVLLAPALVGAGQIKRHRGMFVGFLIWIAASGLGFITIRESMGFGWMVWLISIVVATDIAGYFVGKSLGGPKFWPKVSPKKTWSGTAGGWAAAGLVGAVFAWNAGFGFFFVLISILTSMASQIGDIVESAAKRKLGVKDSSNLIPGHGGFLDRFDGMMGAALFVLIAGLIYRPGGM
ncbi:phosphatidate cytidylyltransferase [Ruegeria arenilitoris]|uniref:phosphatidate cytidylyltransferase n=1 Tax=Ruegeria arenilitoris TaxID=1173585 RepID=UPI00147C6C30|nr:phosphatidate cytidylyltransferase [Ruegeria arenilitoris]